MNLQEIMNQISALGSRIRAESAQLAQDSLNTEIPLADIEKKQADIADMQKRMAALQDSYDTQKAGMENRLTPIITEHKEDKKMENIRSIRNTCFA